jgi:hypothetical protein
MMFDDDYYRIEDAAYQLEMNPQQLLRQSAKGNVQVCVVFSKKPVGKFRKKDTSKPIDTDVFFKALDVVIGKKNIHLEEVKPNDVKETTSIKVGQKSVSLVVDPMFLSNMPYIAIFSLNYLPVQTACPDIYSAGEYEKTLCPSLMKMDDDGLPINQYLYLPPEGLMITPCTDLVITHQELTRLLALKAEHDGKPTAEQLQQQLDEANARIAELEAKQSTDTKQPIQQQREQALLFWVEGMGRDTVMTMTKPQIHEALKKIDPIFRFSDFEKFWQKQQIIKLEAGKPTRNIG